MDDQDSFMQDNDNGGPIVEETIDYSLVYARHTFVANLEGQVCVLKGDSLELLDDSNSYWWLVKCIKTDEIGYIPAENVETPFERLARLNSAKNVQLALITSDDMAEVPVVDPNRKNLVFNEVPDVFENYDEDYYSDYGEEGEEYEEDEPAEAANGNQATSAQKVTSPISITSPKGQKPSDNILNQGSTKNSAPHAAAAAPKSSRASIGTNFLSKLLRRNSSKVVRDKQEPPPPAPTATQQNPRISTRPSPAESRPSGVASPTSDPSKQPISVLRIYAGNVDLKATFKTVSLTKDLTVNDLLEQALRRFRVQNWSPGEYYLSILHGDSQERRLPENDNMLQALEKLKTKHLPGIGGQNNFTKNESSLLINDDNIIKVIINKKLNMYEKNYHLMRVFMFDEVDPSIKTYKTIGVNSDATVREILGMAVKKFKLPMEGYNYSLCSVFKGKEIPLNEEEKMVSILRLGDGSSEDVDFILKKERATSLLGNTYSPMPLVGDPSNAQGGTVQPQQLSMRDDLDTMLKAQPTFLEDVISSSADTSFTSNIFSPQAMSTPDQPLSMQAADTKIYARESFDPAPPISVTQPPSQWQPLTPPDDNAAPPNSNITMYNNYSNNNNGVTASNNPTPTIPAENAPAALPEGSSPKPPTNASSPLPANLTVPPRKGSLKTGVAKEVLELRAMERIDESSVVESFESARTSSEVQRPAAPSSQSNGSISTESRSTYESAPSSIKASFSQMEEYLEEMMKDNSDTKRLSVLQQSLKNGQGSPVNAAVAGIPRTSFDSTNAPSPKPHALSPVSPNKGQRPQRSRAYSNSAVSLKDVYSDIERDLEMSLASPPPQTPQQKSPFGNRSSFFFGGEQMGSTGASDSGDALSASGHESMTSSRINSSMLRSSFASSAQFAKMMAGLKDQKSVVTGDGPADFDTQLAFEKFKEAELFLNTLQRDLEAICGTTCEALGLAM